MMHIDDYSYAAITVNGKTYDKDLIIFPEEVHADWWRKEGHRLVAEDLEKVFTYKPDTLVVGTGESGMMQIPPETKAILKKKNIRLITMVTAAAVIVFNCKVWQGQRVAGAFHLTC